MDTSVSRQGLLLILDGLGDRGLALFDGRTPLEQARTPAMDQLLSQGQGGLVDPVAPGLVVGTHTGTAVLLGVPPAAAVTLGRGPIEAAGIGLLPAPGEVLLRCNFATVEADAGGLRVLNRRAGRIQDGTERLAASLRNLDLGEGIRGSLYPATQHRAVLHLQGDNLSSAISDTDPGSASSRLLSSLPLNDSPAARRTAAAVNRFSQLAHQQLHRHPDNHSRCERGLLAANGVLCRSAGHHAPLPNLIEVLGIKTALVAGESTVLGLGHLLGIDIFTQASFTSLSDTDLAGKFAAAHRAFECHDLVVLHVKAPDICAHDQDPLGKSRILEAIDQQLLSWMGRPLAIAITGDHSTDSNTGRHVGDPVPALLQAPQGRRDACRHFGEAECARGGLGRLSGFGFFCSLIDAMGRMKTLNPGSAKVLGLDR